MQFFSFFNVQPSVLTITGMALMLLMFHILLIPVFNSWYLNFFLLFLANSPGIAVSIMAQLLSFLFTRTVYGFLALISLSHWIITSSKIHFQQHLDHVQTIFHFFFRLCFPHNFQLFLQHHVFPCTCFMPTFPILSQYQISFHFSRHTFYKVVIGLFYLSCVSYSLFKLPVVAQQTRWLLLHLSSQLSSASSMFLLHPFFTFFIVLSFPSSSSAWIPSCCFIIFYFFCSIHTLNQ